MSISYPPSAMQSRPGTKDSSRGFGLRNTLIVLLTLLLFTAACERQSPVDKAAKQLARAREEVKRGKVGAAIIAYRQAVHNDPRLAAAHLELGKLYADRQDYVNGFQQLSMAVDLDGSNDAARL